MSSGYLALWQSLASSANSDDLQKILVSRSFIYIYICIYNSVPNKLPCGTPDVTGAPVAVRLVDAYSLATTS